MQHINVLSNTILTWWTINYRYGMKWNEREKKLRPFIIKGTFAHWMKKKRIQNLKINDRTFLIPNCPQLYFPQMRWGIEKKENSPEELYYSQKYRQKNLNVEKISLDYKFNLILSTPYVDFNSEAAKYVCCALKSMRMRMLLFSPLKYFFLLSIKFLN